ncbi:MAG: TolC family protein [Proteobacteria bacterium]|nr:TolC family protein [Pseudomonadota bacterium]
MKTFQKKITVVMAVFAMAAASARELESPDDFALSIQMTAKLVQQNDPWLAGNEFSQNKMDSMSVALSQLPDPKVTLGLANIAADSFDFGQEAMTQFKVGVSQMFPRGKTLSLKKEQYELLASTFPFQRENRRAKIVVMASQLWLNAYKAQESIALIENDRTLFEHLVDVAEASFTSAAGKTRQQDLIRAQLELTRLDDRLTVLNQNLEKSLQQLNQWLSDNFFDKYNDNTKLNFNSAHIKLDSKLPDIELLMPQLYQDSKATSPDSLFKYFQGHPVVNALEQKIKASETEVELARQKYKPNWGVSASYGYRGDNAMGINRADLFSVGVSFDVPLFTKNRQDKQLEAAISSAAAVETERWMLLREMIASFETEKTQLLRLNQRQELYHSLLLPQMHDQSEASLTAYTNDDGDFAEVVRARIAQLNAEIDALSIDVDRQKTIIKLNYFFMTDADQIIAGDSQFGEKQ